jgi:hypothetical protein
VKQGDKVHARWRKLGEQLLVKYIDGNVRDEMGKVNHPKYQDAWYRRIVQDAGPRLAAPPEPKPEPKPAVEPAQKPAPQQPGQKPTVAPPQ